MQPVFRFAGFTFLIALFQIVSLDLDGPSCLEWAERDLAFYDLSKLLVYGQLSMYESFKQDSFS